MQTSVEQLEGNKVKLHVAVPAPEFEKAIDAAFRKLATQVRIPGFRPGKAPRRLLEARFGPEVAREQAIKDAVPEYYADAVVAEDVDPIAPPEIDITAGEEEGDVEFDAVVEVRPEVTLTGYDELRVELDYEPPSDEAIDAQVDSMRERFAGIEDLEDPLTDGAYAQIDITGRDGDGEVEGLTASDFMYEVGSGILVDELDAELRGRKPGDIVEFDAELTDRFGDRAGETVSFRVLVKETKRKVLPELTDEWVSEVTEFETVDALRDDVRTRMELVGKVQAQMALRDRVLEEAASLVPVEAPNPLVEQEMERRLHDLAHRLEHQGLNIPQYLMATGQDQQAFVDEVREGSTKAVLADLALRAVVAQEQIEASDDELDAEVGRLAERMQQKPEKVRRDLERRGVIEAVRSDIARGKALQFLVDHANVVDARGEALDLSLPEPGEDGEPETSGPDQPADTAEEQA